MSNSRDVTAIIGRQLIINSGHPWEGHRARVVGYQPGFGLRVSIMRGDAMNGHETFVSKPSEYKVVPKGLESL